MAGFNITVAGDSAINLEFGNVISEKTNGLIRAAAQTLEANPINGVIELVPTFCSLMVVYNPCAVGYDELTSQVRGKLRGLVATTGGIHRVVKIPVCYGGDFGPDLGDVAEHAGMSAEEVIAIHSGHDYLIDMLGFLPGFAYLADSTSGCTHRASPHRARASSLAPWESAARKRASTRSPRPAAGASSAAPPCAPTTPIASRPSCTPQATTCASFPSRRRSSA